MAHLKETYDLLQAPEVDVLFVSISGSHAFGFDSPDSDYDLRGAHVAPTRDMLSMRRRTPETWEANTPLDAPCPEEIVTHEIGKFVHLLIKNGGNLLENVISPHVAYVGDASFFAELKTIAPKVVAKGHLRHYLGFADSQIALLRRRPDKEVKIFLYIFRTLMSGVFMARNGTALAHLPTLNRELFNYDFIDVLIENKRSTREEGTLPPSIGSSLLWRYIESTKDVLRKEIDASSLPEKAPNAVVDALDDLVLELRMRSIA